MPSWEEISYEVSQASGMVSVQAECSVTDALQMMKDRAQSMVSEAVDLLGASGRGFARTTSSIPHAIPAGRDASNPVLNPGGPFAHPPTRRFYHRS